MATIFDLSPYNLYHLQSLTPILDDNYRDVLEIIFPILDEKKPRHASDSPLDAQRD